jgi:light-regulated signal transduction histidine kinase (bacteriophytochrome)
VIARADYEPVRLIGASDAVATSLDLSLSTLRSVSPVHREYMRNMGTEASLSISLIRDGRLWGLVSCHNHEPRWVPFATRTACALLGQVLSLQLSAREQTEALGHRMRLQAILTPMVAVLAGHDRLADGVEACRDDLLRLVAADGVGLVSKDEVVCFGSAPAPEQVRELARWLETRAEEQVVAISALGEEFPEAREYAAVASGLLAISASRREHSWVMWFRREVVETVTWGGDPAKSVQPDASGPSARLHPRKSFDQWREFVRGRSRPWLGPEIDVARELRVTVVDIVLRAAERLGQLNEELMRTNRELENFSYTVSHDLRAPFRHIRGYAELLKSEKASQLDDEGRQFLDYVLDGAGYAGRLVDNILGFSRMGRAVLTLSTVDLNEMVREVIRCLKVDGSRSIEWSVEPLPRVEADASMIFRVMQNLLENAVKFTRPRDPARIEVWADDIPAEHVVHVRDNGVGFDPTYAGKLFGMFQRLHAWEDFEGSGIGLASVRRIVGRHGGRVWARGQIDQGATFSFSLPKIPSPTNPLYA